MSLCEGGKRNKKFCPNMQMREELQKKTHFKPFIGKKTKAIGFERKYYGPKNKKRKSRAKFVSM